MKGKILVTTRSFRKIDGPHQQMLRDAQYEIVNSPLSRPAISEELAELMHDIDAAILGVDDCDAEVIKRANSLKVISRYGVGVDSVDIVAATKAGIVVTNTPGANAIAVAEHTLALMLAIARLVPYQDRSVRAGEFSPVTGVELAGATLGIIGFGKIGREVASRARAFGMEIIFYDPVSPSPEVLENTGASSVTLAELIASSDVISLHLPLTRETQNLINANSMNTMKPEALIINTARGGLVDETALYDALKDKRILGAAFDVFAEEPPTNNPLLELDNFIATPHSGSATKQTTLRMGVMASQNALAVLNGERPEHVVNPDVYKVIGRS